VTLEPLHLLVWRDPGMRRMYTAGAADISCGILGVDDDSVRYASARGTEFIVPRAGLQISWRRVTQGCVLRHSGKGFLVYLSPPVAGCPTMDQCEADRISAAYMGKVRTVTIPADETAETAVSYIGAVLGGLAGSDNGSDIGLLAGAFKARHGRRALKARLG
jgi:hypothetical protein